MFQVELTRVVISTNNEEQTIVLSEVDGERSFPIVIGLLEAMSIERRVKRKPMPRPLTHDLLAHTIEQLGGEVHEVHVEEQGDGTFHAKLLIRHDGATVELDCRPSDAVALAVTVDAPIYVAGGASD